jgi:hypothetical protein
MHEDPVVHGEAASPPRIQQLDPLLAQQPPSAEQSGPNAQRLAVRRRALVEELAGLGPVLRASLIERFTQCGKGGCKCMRGEKHGPSYYLTVSYAKGKTEQVYVSKDLKPVAETWVRNYHQAMTVLEEISSINLELIRLKEPETTR